MNGKTVKYCVIDTIEVVGVELHVKFSDGLIRYSSGGRRRVNGALRQ